MKEWSFLLIISKNALKIVKIASVCISRLERRLCYPILRLNIFKSDKKAHLHIHV